MRSLLRTLSPPLHVQGLPEELAGLPATIPELLRARVADGNRPFIIDPDGSLTYAEADERSAELAGRFLAMGIGKGTRVGLLFPNGSDWVVTWLAAARIGALTVPLSTFSPGAELARAIRQTDIHSLVCASHFAGSSLTQRIHDGLLDIAGEPDRLVIASAPYLRWIHVAGTSAPSWSMPLAGPLPREIVRNAQDDVVAADALAIISTSGATAVPKAVVHTHGSLVRHAALLARGAASPARTESTPPCRSSGSADSRWSSWQL